MRTAAGQVQPVLGYELADVEIESCILGELGHRDGLGGGLGEEEEGVAVVGCAFGGVGRDVWDVWRGEREWHGGGCGKGDVGSRGR